MHLLNRRKHFSVPYTLSKPSLVTFASLFAVIGMAFMLHSFASSPTLIGDENNDGVVNVLDLSILLSNWHTNNTAVDLNGDGYVDVIDLSLLLSHWGQTASTTTPPPRPLPSGPWININPPISFNFNNPPNNYGSQIIAVAPNNPSTVYVGTNYQGIWKTADTGASWTRLGMTNSSGSSGCNSFDGRNWALAVDPTDANVVYTVNGFGCYQGLWKTIDGGVTWQQALDQKTQSQATSDIYSIEIDPSNHNHILLGAHSGWNGGTTAGVLESLDAGTSWILHQPPVAWGAGFYVHFFGNSSTWLLTTQYSGMYLTSNAGTTWTQVTTEDMAHGMNEVYHSSSTGTWYVTAVHGILKSTDNGNSWTTAFSSPCTDGFGAIIGYGSHLYAAPANTGGTTCGQVSYYTALETDDTHWSVFNNQTFSDGPMAMTIDPIQQILYSSNWDGGVWKLPL